MNHIKPFDCVAYKRAIQEKHAAATQGLSPQEKTRQRRQWLSQSDNPAARLWREMKSKQEPVVSH
jgi:hypothetical protein